MSGRVGNLASSLVDWLRGVCVQGIITLIVNGNFKSLGFALFAGPYDDYSPDWYARQLPAFALSLPVCAHVCLCVVCVCLCLFVNPSLTNVQFDTCL